MDGREPAYAPSSGNYWAYDNDDANVETYGYLYEWETACDVCPDGWHLPCHAEWTELTDYLGGRSVAGGKLKETDTTHWEAPNEGATNETGFTALPGGFRNTNGSFLGIGRYGFWWTATEYSTPDAWNAWDRGLYTNDSKVHSKGANVEKELGLSVRCLRD